MLDIENIMEAYYCVCKCELCGAETWGINSKERNPVVCEDCLEHIRMNKSRLEEIQAYFDFLKDHIYIKCYIVAQYRVAIQIRKFPENPPLFDKTVGYLDAKGLLAAMCAAVYASDHLRTSDRYHRLMENVKKIREGAEQ